MSDVERSGVERSGVDADGVPFTHCYRCGGKLRKDISSAGVYFHAEGSCFPRPPRLTPAEEAVIRAAVAMREATEGKRDRPMREYQEALLNLVDALLAARPEWKP